MTSLDDVDSPVINDLEQLSIAKESGIKPENIILSNNIPILNHEAYLAYEEIIGEGFSFVASFELTAYELLELYSSLPKGKGDRMVIPLYGRVPLMVSAGCVKQTEGRCDKKSGITYLFDRKNVAFPVINDCKSCTNTIYNSLPLSAHMLFLEGKEISFANRMQEASFIISFTVEEKAERENVLKYYTDLMDGKISGPPEFSYTTGHLKRKTL